MQVNDSKTLHSSTRYDGIKTAAFVLFCLGLSLFMVGGTLALWFLQ
jgi:hypothetical protein